jgi:membrane fusion protein (multidrug efflux system)
VVEKGDLMARLDAREIELELAQAQVNYEETKHRLVKAEVAVKEARERENNAQVKETKAKKDYEKTLSMFSDELAAEDELAVDKLAWEQAVSELDLARLQNNQVELDLELSKTELNKMKISMDTAELRLSRTRIEAPFNGFITFRGATVGMTVSSSTNLFTLVNRDTLVAHLNIAQEEILKVEKGMPVKVRCDAIPEKIFNGVIQIINPVVDPQSGTVRLRMEIGPENRELLRPGMFITARIITVSRENALLIPRKAVFYDDEKPTFFLIDEKNEVRKVHFEPGASTETALEISTALPPDALVCNNARIVIVGQDNLKNGDKVNIVEENH